MKLLSFAVAIALYSFLVKQEASGGVFLTAWLQGTHFYSEEPIVFTCEVKGNFSKVWTYSWFRHNLSKPATLTHAPMVNNYSYSITTLPAIESGTYWCTALEKGTNNTFRSNNVSLTVTADTPSMSLESHPNRSQHPEGKGFSLRCSVNGSRRASWALMQLHGTAVHTVCSQTGNGTEENPEECVFNKISSSMSGLYWCRSTGRNQRSKYISITVSDNADTHSEEEGSSGPWLAVVCAIVSILFLIPLILLLVPCVRQRIKFFPAKAPGMVSAQQEMPQTKQDVTEIQWDLGWMEMANLLDKQQYPGR